jgi:hypothetical protein
MGWYLFGRLMQFVWRNGDAPGWWSNVALALLGSGLFVWAGRRVRWHRSGRSHAISATSSAVDSIAAAYGLQIHRPAGPWVSTWAPAAFLSAEATVGPALWPWAATGMADGTPLLLAAQRAQVRNATGLTSTRVRTACIARCAGLHLPHVVVSEREAIPPALRHQSIQFELEEFNRSLWVWGRDLKGVYDVVHPRAMAHVLRNLPDGARLLFSGEVIAATTDEPIAPAQLHGLIECVTQSARLVPSFLAKPAHP